ncbi:SEL1-like repeat protein [Microvirga thermotolerans]|uniref:Sel1 repeat family protein n=1 Tax=Microvirga thermotolerans TaxID=2651334 RepID=A0A5P9JWH8_9HYPH|nr:SEL1-like repeat protein [Microvirga thermotolerans]QFU15555.1 hypothetical protein GDR74_04630 [Microvirga thermotolerans]
MKRPDPAHLDALDPQIRAAAEKAARQAGLSLEDWIAAAMERYGADGSQMEKSGAGSQAPAVENRGGAFEAVLAAAETEEAERPLPDQASRNVAALEAMALWIEQTEDRLEETARAFADRQEHLSDILSRNLSFIRSRLEAVERRAATPAEEAARALTPLTDALDGLRLDLSRLAQRLDAPAAAAVDEIRRHMERLREGLEGLATRSEVATLDEALRMLSRDLERAPSSKDLLTLAGSVAGLDRKVGTLSETIAHSVRERIGAEIEELKAKIGELARSSVDRSVIDFLSSQIVDLRQDLARRAEPQQIERLTESVAALSRKVEDVRAEQAGHGDLAALKRSLEEVCGALNRTVALQEESDVPRQLQDMSRRLDLLADRPAPDPARLDSIADQLAALTERMARMAEERREQAGTLDGLFDRLSAQVAKAVEGAANRDAPLLERFDRLEEKLGASADLPIPSGLEERLAACADELSRIPDACRQAFDEAAARMKSLQGEALRIAERTAAAAAEKAQAGLSSGSEIDEIKASLVELKALQARAERKTQQTLVAVHDALAALLSRSSGPPAASRGPESAAPDLPAPDRLEAAVRRLQASAMAQIEEIAATIPQDAAAPAAEPGLDEVRASFIAAARRASRTLPPTDSEPHPQRDDPAAEASPSADDEPAEAPGGEDRPVSSFLERLRRTFDAHRRSLLFGFACLVLAAGTSQILTNAPRDAAPAPVPGGAKASEPVVHEAAPAAALPAHLAHAEENLFQPSSLTVASAPGVPSARFVLDPGTLGALPAETPADLRQAALSGDAAAVYEIALKAAEGRGLPRDPALAFRLFERAAQAGLAPAQERLAALYDKGIGTQRDAKLAVAWYERAARGGNLRSMHNLATLLAAGALGRADYAAALRWYREAAEAGIRDSQFNLGVLHASGAGTRKDPAQAFRWFALAAAQGDAEAARKRDEVAARLSPEELAAARAAVEAWRPRPSDPLANDVPPRTAERTAAVAPAPDGRS